MKRHWDEQELADHWSLSHDEFGLLAKRTERSRLGFAAMLKFFQLEGRFPSERKEVPTLALDYLASQLDVAREAFARYELSGRSWERDRAQIRSLLGFRRGTLDDSKNLGDWLLREVLPVDHQPEHLHESALEWCRRNHIEPPTASRLQRIIGSALKAYETDLFAVSYEKMPKECRAAMDTLLHVPDESEGAGREITPFSDLRADPGRVGLASVLEEIAKLKRIAALGLPDDLFASVPSKVLQKYCVRAVGERAREKFRKGST